MDHIVKEIIHSIHIILRNFSI